MAKKTDISTKKLEEWDKYKGQTPEDIAKFIYAHIEVTSVSMCNWYWTSISSKRVTSFVIRIIAFILLILGTTLPIFAAIQDKPEEKLLLTQLAVGFLAIAGLSQIADKVFGWSSGWMRYITTVTTMENLIRAFQMEWAKYLVAKTSPIDSSDAKTLFDLAKGLEQELVKLQAEETTKWVVEFNTGISLLDTMIKTQREETDKKLEAIRTSLTSQEASAKAEEKAKLPGSLEIKLTFKAEPKKLKISLNNETAIEFLGNSWSRLELTPGRHLVKLVTTSETPRTIERIAEVKADSLTIIEIAVGE
jgi:hypothetical protein